MNDCTLSTLCFQCPQAVFSPISVRSASFTPLAFSFRTPKSYHTILETCAISEIPNFDSLQNAVMTQIAYLEAGNRLISKRKTSLRNFT